MASTKEPGVIPFDPNMKTLFVLGAGFSMDAGGPAQSQILPSIFQMPDSTGREFVNAKKRFVTFASDYLGIPEARLATISLEDIYTPIDRCLADGISLRGMGISALLSIRKEVDYLISKAIAYRLEHTDKDARYVKDFASKIVSIAKHRKRLAQVQSKANGATQFDPLAIISLNWDILLDNALNGALSQQDAEDGLNFDDKYAPQGVVDYCCYVSSLEDANHRVRPGLWALGAKGYNIKLLKLHGSLNWLQCETCQRLFVSFGQKSAVPNYLKANQCRHCKKQDIRSNLRSTLVMPTFLKDLSNFQLKLVWQNAGVEIMEARQLVFIGYSLPYADFEFRQLLARFSRRDTTVDVVLFSRDPKDDQPFKDTCDRFGEFFGKERLRVFSAGAADYVQRCLWSHL